MLAAQPMHTRLFSRADTSAAQSRLRSRRRRLIGRSAARSGSVAVWERRRRGRLPQLSVEFGAPGRPEADAGGTTPARRRAADLDSPPRPPACQPARRAAQKSMPDTGGEATRHDHLWRR